MIVLVDCSAVLLFFGALYLLTRRTQISVWVLLVGWLLTAAVMVFGATKVIQGGAFVAWEASPIEADNAYARLGLYGIVVVMHFVAFLRQSVAPKWEV